MKAFSRVLRAQQKPRTGSRVSTRFYSPRPSGGTTDRNSGTLLGVTAGLLLGGFYVSHLETAPESGRRRFMAVSKRQEELLRTQALQETRAQFRGRILPPEHPLTQQVRRITRRIIVASNLGHLEGEGAAEPPALIEDPEWAVLVVDDPSFVNAFAAAGLVCVSTGIMPIARNEEGLAAIIGHEIGHVAMRHPAELLSQSKILLPVMVLLAFIGVDFGLSSVLTDVLHSLPHSRALETEADTVGLKLMSRACYDPAAAPRVFEDMSRLEKGSQVPSFFRTHPPTADRVAHLKTLLPESYSIYNANPECVQLEEMRARGLLRRVRMNVI
ncbi:peptidase family M48-domain-containing protein [Mycena olivaceomarginata]|nr:peptidase family M48-domain-containing protein [Mycena olivaceomarginata]